MSWRSNVTLSEAENSAFYAALAFLGGRLERRDTLDWALELSPSERASRLALLHLIEYPAKALQEPWSSAWRLVEEFWNQPPPHRPEVTAYALRQRVVSGERSGGLVSDMIELVAPRLAIAPRGSQGSKKARVQKRVPSVAEILQISLTGQTLVKPSDLAIGEIGEALFLDHLARALEGALNHFVALAERLGWASAGSWWRLGEVRRVYAVEGDDDPDEYASGIASTVKLLHATVAQLSNKAPRVAARYVASWESGQTPLHLRLWAAAAFDSSVVSAAIVGDRLLSLDKREFWNLHSFPEIAQLRAIRFAELTEHSQRALARRIMRLPPREQWGRHSTDMARIDDARIYWAARELRRIETAGGQLPDFATQWLRERLPRFPELVADVSLTEGFLEGVRVEAVKPNPDSQYDVVEGTERLMALEAAMASSRSAWDDDPGRRAQDWINESDHVAQLLDDFEAAPLGASAFPKVWDKFGWTDEPSPDASAAHLQVHARRVLRLLAFLSDKAIGEAISGLAWWLHRWEKSIVDFPEFEAAWTKMWPFAVAATNALQPEDEESELNITVSPGENEPRDLDTLNSPVGYLIGVFFQVWRVTDRKPPFEDGSLARRMRDTIIAAPGRAGLIAKRSFIEQLPAFMNADPDWTKATLLPPLFAAGSDAIVLWRGVAHRTIHRNTIILLGDEIVARIGDKRLGRRTQKNLLFSVTIECLHAFREGHAPAIGTARLTQLLRSLDDEVRANAAEAIHTFVRDLSKSKAAGTDPELRPDRLFARAARPFLESVWPQERSLSTPGVSRSFADLPAVSGEAFSEAVATISRFLVPFNCWSLMDFGLYGDEDGAPRLASIVNNAAKARALLAMLDLSVGTGEGSVIPHDIGIALIHIQKLSPASAKTPAFRRLSVAARL